MYFTSQGNEAIQQIIKTQIEGIQFEIPLTRAFFPQHDILNAKKHNHANYEVFFNKQSSGKMLVQNEVIEFSDNSIVIVAPQVYHAYKPDENRARDVIKYTLKFSYAADEKTEKLFDQFDFRYARDMAHIFQTIERIHSVYGADEFGVRQEVGALFSVLLVQILREMTKDTATRGADIGLPEYRDKAVEVAQIEAFFEKHYDAFPAPADLAKHLNVSTRQLDRILKQLFGVSFSGKLVSTKTELAKDLLKSTDLSVTEISQRLGYLSPASFSASFKKQTGVSPNSFRHK
ncbi:MAG: helix-turn-helix transcriptional regulator [Clostridia bacterium]|nr:helix-turn-helix transcriptional regulator [Clostridia bacterium]